MSAVVSHNALRSLSGDVSVPELGQEVQSAMADVLPSLDPLDATDFDAIEYLNSKFTTERSLSQLDTFIADVTAQIGELDEEISRAVHAQAEAGARASRDIAEAREAMTELHSKIGEIKHKADESEAIVREICRDIKELDCAKKNLVASITALKRTNMLTTGLTQLRKASKPEAANLLDALANILQHFEPYGDVPRISEVKVEVTALRERLQDEVMAAFAATKEQPSEPPEGFKSIAEACALVDALGAREDQINAFCEQQLKPYEELFHKGGEYSSLDDAERRFAWIRRLLKGGWGETYPEDWHIEYRVVQAFAVKTADMFLEILQSGGEHNVAATLKALQKSLVFEKEVKARYSPPENDKGLKLAAVFDPFMQPYVALEKQKLAEVLTTEDHIDEQGALPVFSSSVQMFAYIKTSVKRCTALTTGQTFFKLHKAFCACLNDYAKRLSAKLPSASMEVACYCLNTAEYCGETVEQLGDIVKSKIDTAYTDRIDLEEEQDAFHDVIAAAVKRIVAVLDTRLEPALKAMSAIQWHALDSVDEESNYVRAVNDSLRAAVPAARALLSPLYFRNLCDKFVAHFLPKFYQTLLGAKRINEVGTHQLLLDLHSLKDLFLNLPALLPDHTNAGSQEEKPPAPSNTYTKFVSRHLSKIEMVLKLVGTPTEMLVERFKIMWPDGTKDDLLNVCALKGLKKIDQQHLVDTLYGGGGSLNSSEKRRSSSGSVPPLLENAASAAERRSPSQEPFTGIASLEQRSRAFEYKLESVSAQASLTINKVGSQMLDLINKSNPSRAVSTKITGSSSTATTNDPS